MDQAQSVPGRSNVVNIWSIQIPAMLSTRQLNRLKVMSGALKCMSDRSAAPDISYFVFFFFFFCRWLETGRTVEVIVLLELCRL